MHGSGSISSDRGGEGNLTIALIERDRDHPRVFLRELPEGMRAGRVAAARRSRFVPDPVRPADIYRSGVGEDRRWYPEGVGAGGAVVQRGPLMLAEAPVVYETHRMAAGGFGIGAGEGVGAVRFVTGARKSEGLAVDSVGRFLDVFI